MADLSINLAGIKSPNPFWVASGPLLSLGEDLRRIDHVDPAAIERGGNLLVGDDIVAILEDALAVRQHEIKKQNRCIIILVWFFAASKNNR